ncbi:SET domain-containing protein-lysine N-methyltransferase [Candidatus Woesearchaeota archaeon]|nr:SET domain-containing protein-lysine N-methyltransferase [Candidatus Woesearchaeota archaeon]
MLETPLMIVKESGIHNRGAFAKTNIKKGISVVEYVGEKISKQETEKRQTSSLEAAKQDSCKGSVYIFELNKEFDIDGDVSYNLAKYINHSCEPNCEIKYIDGRIWIVAKRNIKEGEEITYNYGFDLEDYQDYPCRCGSRNCAGYIVDEEDWPELFKMAGRAAEKN